MLWEMVRNGSHLTSARQSDKRQSDKRLRAPSLIIKDEYEIKSVVISITLVLGVCTTAISQQPKQEIYNADGTTGQVQIIRTARYGGFYGRRWTVVFNRIKASHSDRLTENIRSWESNRHLGHSLQGIPVDPSTGQPIEDLQRSAGLLTPLPPRLST